MRFLLGYGSCGIASGAKVVLEGLCKAFEGTDYKVEKVGCNGLCFAEPIVEVITDSGESILYGRLNEASAAELAEGVKKGELPLNNRLSDEDMAFLNGQKRIVLSGCGKIDPENIESYIEKGGYTALKMALSMGAEKIIEEIKDFCDYIWLENLNLRGTFKPTIINYINEKHPELNDLYNKIYIKKDMSYWEQLDKKVQEYADKNGFMYVIESSFSDSQDPGTVHSD